MSNIEFSNDNQEALFDALVENGGDVEKAAEQVGYSVRHAYNLVHKFKKQFREKTDALLQLKAVRAAKVLTDALERDPKKVPIKTQLDAAKNILDRTQANPLEVEDGVLKGIFVIPAKDNEHSDTE